MEQRSLEEDRPYARPEPHSFPWVEAVLAILLTAGTIYLFYYFQAGREPSPVPAVKKPPATVPHAEAPAAVRNPLPAPDGDANLPTLANSDSMMREALAALLGRKTFDDFVVPDRLIPRIVATIDNLPHRTAPRRLMPLNPVSGPLITGGSGSVEMTLDSQNYRRYAPYIRVMEAVPASALVKIYIDTYPLFQRAYEELGYKEMYFNDRLVVAIDDMLEAPEIRDPVKLARPKVFYEFADPDLETRSAGQKILIRMGPENAQRVKAKLGEIRQALAQPQSSAPERPAKKK
jgi:hypothetical protein